MYMCITGMKCIENSKLQIHMRRVHSDERPFECTQCDKKYPTKSELNNHILNAHTEIKPFPCGYCDKRFTHEAKLKRHEVQNQVDDIPYFTLFRVTSHLCSNPTSCNYEVIDIQEYKRKIERKQRYTFDVFEGI